MQKDVLTEQTRKRNENRFALLQALHFNGNLSKTDISRLCGLRKSSVTNLVSELLDLGWIVECEPGRTRSPLQLNFDSWYFLSALLTPAEIIVAKFNFYGQMELKATEAIKDSSPKELCKQIAQSIQAVNQNNCSKPLNIGISFPGIIDSNLGRVLYAANFTKWSDIPLKEIISSEIKQDVTVVNDVRAQLFAECWFEKYFTRNSNILLLNFSYGVSCSMMIHGREVAGAQNAAGEIGHVCAGDEGRECSCGKQDCLESYCSIPAMCRTINGLFPDSAHCNSAEDIYASMQQERRIQNIVERCCAQVAHTITPVMAAIDPELILVATQDCNLSKFMVQALRQHLRIELAGISSREAEILTTRPVHEDALKGVAATMIHKAFSSGVI